MTPMPRVSILVPSYNHARFLRPCLDSVLAQTYDDWELILIDDGSTDDSVEIARSFPEPRFAVCVNEVNLGTYGTQQRALQMATGELVAVLNSDDVWEPDKLRLQVAALDRHPEASACYTRGWMANSFEAEREVEDVHSGWPTDEIQETLPFLLESNKLLASTLLFRREGLRFDPTCRYSGDWVALLEAAVRGPFACVSQRLSLWRMHDNNTFVRSPGQVLEEIRVREAIARNSKLWHVRDVDPRAIRRGLGLNVVHLFALYLFFHDMRGARKASWSALLSGTHTIRALKRVAGSVMPEAVVSARIWHGKDAGGYLGDREEGLRMVRSMPRLEFRP